MDTEDCGFMISLKFASVLVFCLLLSQVLRAHTMKNPTVGQSWDRAVEASPYCKTGLEILRLNITDSFTYDEEQIKTIYLQLEKIAALPTGADAGTFHREFFIPSVA